MVAMHPDCALVLKVLDMSPARAARYTAKMLKTEDRPVLRAAMVRTLAQLDQYLAAVRDLTAPPLTGGPMPSPALIVRIATMPTIVRILSGPTFFAGVGAWEVTVSFPAYSAKTARKVYDAMPDCIEHEGRTYYKHGFRVADSKAWYRTKGI